MSVIIMYVKVLILRLNYLYIYGQYVGAIRYFLVLRTNTSMLVWLLASIFFFLSFVQKHRPLFSRAHVLRTCGYNLRVTFAARARRRLKTSRFKGHTCAGKTPRRSSAQRRSAWQQRATRSRTRRRYSKKKREKSLGNWKQQQHSVS